MKKRILLIAILGMLVSSMFATHINVSGPEIYINANNSPYNTIQPGDTLYIVGGTFTTIGFLNFHGSASLPIVIINKGAIVLMTLANHGMKIINCTHLKITGTGTADFYGFQATHSVGDGVSIEQSSDYISMDHFLCDYTMRSYVAKTDVDCGFTQTREKLHLHAFHFTYCYGGHTNYEGFYIGDSHYTGQTFTKAQCPAITGADTTILPATIDTVTVSYCTTAYTGWDGIQVGSTLSGHIDHCLVMFDSQADSWAQNTGIIQNDGSVVDVYNNYVYHGKGTGLAIQGPGNTKIYNNIIVGAGTGSTATISAIYVGAQSQVAGHYFYLCNNTIINPKNYGLNFTSNLTTGNLWSYNVIVNPGTGYTTGVTNYTSSNNYNTATIGSCMFNDTLYTLLAGSPLIDVGTGNTGGITTDYLGNSRPYNTNYDIGAEEYQGGGGPPPPTYYVPTVSTSSIGCMTQTSACGGGNATNDGGAAISEKGLCWTTTGTPTIANTHLADGPSTGTYSLTISGLTANTIYHVRAYATNSVGTGYGDMLTFTTLATVTLPVVTTKSATYITKSSCRSGGNVTYAGSSPVTARGVCWAKTSTPTIANSHTTNNSGVGNFTSSITGLTASTVYYIRAYATSAAGTSYGAPVKITTRAH